MSLAWRVTTRALTEHRRALRDAFGRHDGVEVDTQGDSFFVAFSSAGHALDAAAAGRDALTVGPIRVRMGLHTGEPLVGTEGYVGADVNLAARIAACGARRADPALPDHARALRRGSRVGGSRRAPAEGLR